MVDATQVQIRRDTETNLNGVTPALAELAYDVTNKRLRLGDGSTLGAILTPNAFDIQQAAFQFAVAGGTADALTVTLTPVPLSYSQPLTIRVKITATNTGATTIDVNGLGVRNILKMSEGTLSSLAAGDLVSGGIYEMSYDGTQFQLTTQYNTGIISVSQGDLNTATGTFSAAPNTAVTTSSLYRSSSAVTLPGGQYGFWIESNAANVGVFSGWWPGRSSTGYSNQAIAWAAASGGVGSAVNGRQRYITSSPPFNIGDGDVGGFIFALVNNAGDIVGHYSADVPPWGYNGPTDIMCSHKCVVTGKKFRRVMKKRSFEQLMDGAKIQYEMQEITNDIKNADMKLIPHPFGDVPEDHRVVLLDPMSDMVSRLIEMQNNGMSEEVSERLTSKYLQIDNNKISRASPDGVNPVKFKFKKTKGSAAK